jgi:hypothetical protein
MLGDTLIQLFNLRKFIDYILHNDMATTIRTILNSDEHYHVRFLQAHMIVMVVNAVARLFIHSGHIVRDEAGLLQWVSSLLHL